MAALMKTLVFVVASGFLLAALPIPGALRSNDIALAQEKGIAVRVLLFSGRPDPTYMLEDAQMVAQLKANIAEAKKLDAFDRESVIPATIGYKGILVSNPEMKAGLPARFAVFNGTIELMDGRKRFLEDKGGMIEKMLLDEAVRKGVIEDVVLKRMKKNQ